jgi:predicted RNA-binding protein with PIN domain
MAGSIRDRQIYVVSSDSLVQTDALGHGALRVSSKEFLGKLAEAEQEIRTILAGQR